MLLHVNWMPVLFAFILCLVNHLYAQDCNDTDIRLTGGRDEREGRVEVCIGQEWGTVCNNSWDVADVVVVCRQLGLDSEAPAVTQTFSMNETTTGPILLDNVTCTGTETTLTDCPHNGFGIHNCSHTQDAGVSCPGYFAECNDTDVRLVGGVESQSETFGRVEICFGGVWGTVCDDFWNNPDASVVYKQLGHASEHC